MTWLRVLRRMLTHLLTPNPQQPTTDTMPPRHGRKHRTRCLGLGHNPQLLFDAPTTTPLNATDKFQSQTSLATLLKTPKNHPGRDARYRAPPGQIRASAANALGSHLGCLTMKRCCG